MRIAPELRAGVDGPLTGAEPPAEGERHDVFAGFEETDVLPFGGRIEAVRVEDGAVTPLTLVPPFPIYPPEKSWMQHPPSALPALVLREGARRVAYLAADLDRCFDRDRQPDHARLLGRLVRWAAGGDVPLAVEGPGTIDCRLYAGAGGRIVLHLVNLTGTTSHTGPVDELIPVGPHRVRIRRPEGSPVARAHLAVLGADAALIADGDWLTVEVPAVEGHEVIILW